MPNWQIFAQIWLYCSRSSGSSYFWRSPGRRDDKKMMGREKIKKPDVAFNAHVMSCYDVCSVSLNITCYLIIFSLTLYSQTYKSTSSFSLLISLPIALSFSLPLSETTALTLSLKHRYKSTISLSLCIASYLILFLSHFTLKYIKALTLSLTLNYRYKSTISLSFNITPYLILFLSLSTLKHIKALTLSLTLKHKYKSTISLSFNITSYLILFLSLSFSQTHKI